MLDEFGLEHGEVRVDVAVINGELHGYEIKSERDTLERLPRQVKAYSAVLGGGGSVWHLPARMGRLCWTRYVLLL
jgi:hypothetical protein